MVSNEVIVGALLAVNIVLYIPLVWPTLNRRRHRVHASNLAEAFKGLDRALKQAVPDLGTGFTWEEAVARLRSSGVQTKGVEVALRSYEEYRYGGNPLPNSDYHDVVKVANMLGGISAGKSGGTNIGR